MKPIDMKAGRAWLVALLLAGAGCADEKAPAQVISGKVTNSGAVAVRAVRGDVVVTASQVRTDGSFTIVLPVAGERYRLEVLTTSGVRHVYSQAEGGALADLSFRVCQPTDPYDLGGLGGSRIIKNSGNSGGDSGTPEPWPCTPEDPACSDPNQPCSNPMDPGCGLPPTPGCADPADPYCFCDATGECPPPFCGGTEPGNPGQPEDPDAPTSSGGGSSGWDPTCPPPPPEPCWDPTDPTACNDPCAADPASCGCAPGDQNCWPAPQEPTCDSTGNACEPGGPGGITPQNPPIDFGCDDSSTEPADPVPLPAPAGPNE